MRALLLVAAVLVASAAAHRQPQLGFAKTDAKGQNMDVVNAINGLLAAVQSKNVDGFLSQFSADAQIWDSSVCGTINASAYGPILEGFFASTKAINMWPLQYAVTTPNTGVISFTESFFMTNGNNRTEFVKIIVTMDVWVYNQKIVLARIAYVQEGQPEPANATQTRAVLARIKAAEDAGNIDAFMAELSSDVILEVHNADQAVSQLNATEIRQMMGRQFAGQAWTRLFQDDRLTFQVCGAIVTSGQKALRYKTGAQLIAQYTDVLVLDPTFKVNMIVAYSEYSYAN